MGKIFSFICAVTSAAASFGIEQSLAVPGVGDVRLSCNRPGGWAFSLAAETAGDGVPVVRVDMSAAEASTPPTFEVKFAVPGVGVYNVWSPYDEHYQTWPQAWNKYHYSSQLAFRAPIAAAFGGDENKCAIATSEALRRVEYGLAVTESTCNFEGCFKFFTAYEPPRRAYSTKIRIDRRKVFWADAVRAASDWITETAGLKPCKVPEAAFDPLYSSWYAFWQDVHDKTIEKEMPIAASLGMKTAILDDGWQKEESATFYSATGDWMPVKGRFPDMKEHVAKVHAAGMKYMLWLSVPYVGDESAAWERLKDKFLYGGKGKHPGDVGVLDPRFPEVREYLCQTYERVVRDWGFDGVKLDFIDQFVIRPGTVDPAEKDGFAGRDIRSMPEAVDRLMRDVTRRLQAINPDVLIEFRQQYMGPAIRQYGNMIRGTDCPADFAKNRKIIADLRLTSGGTAVHSDMLTWNRDETPEGAAKAILSALFGVIQYSMVLDTIPPAHKEVIRHWLAFSQAHRETLLKGAFRPRHPELLYPLIEAESAAEKVFAVYSAAPVVELGGVEKPAFVVNATDAARVPAELSREAGVEYFDVFGRSRGRARLKAGLVMLEVPVSGYCRVGD